MITDTDLGWIAGILDFQGHIVRKDNSMRASGSLQITLYVETSRTEIVAQLGVLTGNAPEAMRPSELRAPDITRKGCAEHCPQAHVHVTYEGSPMPPQARWTVSGAACAVVLWNLRPLLVTAKEPWDWAMAMCFASTRVSGQGSGTAMAAVRRLAALGWGIPPLFRDAVPAAELEAAR